MPGEGSDRKQRLVAKFIKLLDSYPCLILCKADFVGSAHMQSVRRELRPLDAVLVMGKNTLVRKTIRNHLVNNPQLDVLIPHIKGNVGFVFCQNNLVEVRKILVENRVAAPAKPGVIAPVSVSIPAGNTGLEPTQTSFLQALNIPSKIVRGQIEIIKDVEVVHKGDKVGSSEATLLAKLNIKPFTYGLEVTTVYDNGSVYASEVLDMTDDVIVNKFLNGVRNVASVSLALSMPTVAALPHVILNGYKNIMAIALATDYSFEQIARLKEIADNPELAAQLAAEAAASSAAAAASTADTATTAAAAADDDDDDEDDEEIDMDDLF